MKPSVRTVTTTCPLDCWDACSVIATVENGRVVSLRGNDEHPFTRGFLCAKTARYPERVYSPDRILHPMLRAGDGRFVRISWDDALDRVADTIRTLRDTVGTPAIFHMQSAGSMGFLKKLSHRFFSLVGGVTEAGGDICFGAGHMAMEAAMGEQSSHDPLDVANSRTIVFWGRDPITTGIHSIPFLMAAKARGARLASVNPIRIDRSGLFDLQVQPEPGKDCFLALYAIKRLLAEGRVDRGFVDGSSVGFAEFLRSIQPIEVERLPGLAGVTREEAEALLDLYRAHPAATWIGSGVQHHLAGVEVVALLLALGAMTGNVGVPGGGVSFYHRHRRALDGSWFEPRRSREIPMANFWKHLDDLEPPIRMMWINGTNPVHALPCADRVAEAIRRIPFVVGVDFHWTDSMRLAHLVLPTTSFLEEDGIVTSYGQNLIGRQRRVIDPLGEARSDLSIFQALAERLGFEAEMGGSEETWVARVARTLAGPGDRLRDLESKGFTQNPLLPAVPHSDGRFRTASGKFEFPRSVDLARFERDDPPAGFPLRLLTPKGKKHHLSQVNAARAREASPISLHPTDAARAGVAARDRVTVASERAEIEAFVEIDETLRPGLAVMPLSGNTLGRNNVNRLTGDELAGDGMTPAYYRCFVAVRR